MKSIRLLSFLLLLLLSTLIHAQTYEIRAVNKGSGFVGVEIRITSGTPPATTNFLSDLVFGLKWQSSYNVELVSTITTNYSIIKSGVRKLKDGFYYQAFSAANTPSPFPAAWTINNWVEIMSIRNTLTGNGFGTFEIVETGFDVTTDPNFGLDLIDYTPVIVGSATNVLLPVNLTEFTVASINRVIGIRWSTASEQNSKGFEVERSEGEANSFKKIGWIDSKGNGSGNKDYEFMDKGVSGGVKYYYRLKQVDNDDKYKYSEVRTAMLDDLDNKAIRIMPNPVNNVLRVLFDNTVKRGAVIVKVVDAKGTVVLSQSHYMDVNGSANVNVLHLANGQYFLVIEKADNTIYVKAFQKNE